MQQHSGDKKTGLSKARHLVRGEIYLQVKVKIRVKLSVS